MRCPGAIAAGGQDRLPGSARAQLASKWGDAWTSGALGWRSMPGTILSGARLPLGAPSIGTKRGTILARARSREKENEEPSRSELYRNRSPRKVLQKPPASPLASPQSKSRSTRPPASPLGKTRQPASPPGQTRTPASPSGQTRPPASPAGRCRPPVSPQSQTRPPRQVPSTQGAQPSVTSPPLTMASHEGATANCVPLRAGLGLSTPRIQPRHAAAACPRNSGPSSQISEPSMPTGRKHTNTVVSRARSGTGARCASRGSPSSTPHMRCRDISPSTQAFKPAFRVGVPWPKQSACG